MLSGHHEIHLANFAIRVTWFVSIDILNWVLKHLFIILLRWRFLSRKKSAITWRCVMIGITYFDPYCFYISHIRKYILFAKHLWWKVLWALKFCHFSPLLRFARVKLIIVLLIRVVCEMWGFQIFFSAHFCTSNNYAGVRCGCGSIGMWCFLFLLFVWGQGYSISKIHL